jgi:uncharacterized membrane protein
MAYKSQLSQFLGWFSIGLGLTQLTNPGGFVKFIGLKDEPEYRKWVVGIGLREIICGVALLIRPTSAKWLQARVVGDAMDLSLLGTALNSGQKKQPDRVVSALAAVAGITALDFYGSQSLSNSHHGNGRISSNSQAASPIKTQENKGMQVKSSITINGSPETLYRFWRDFTNLPRFMKHLEAVQVMENGRSHWKAKAPAGASVEWDAEIVNDQPNRLIAWRSLKDAQVDNSGSVRFEPATGQRGTVVRVELTYNPPAGKLGAIVAKLFGEEPQQQVNEDLRAFKQMMEVGEVLLSDATVHDRPHAAQPPKFSQAVKA